MAAGTFSFDHWLFCLEMAAAALAPHQRLQLLATEAQETFGAVIWFAEIFGWRWSYIAGTGSKGFQAGTIDKIPLGDGLGLVCATWGAMTLFQQTAFVGLIKRQIKLRSQDTSL